MKVLLHLADIQRSTYCYWVGNFDCPNPDMELKGFIQAIYDEHEGLYVYRHISDELKNRG
ncbi:hypothetical protein ACUXEY_000170 [Bacillus sp. F9_6S_D1_P_5]